LSSSLFMRDPFRLEDVLNFHSDQHTRIMLFATGLEPTPGDSPLLVTVQLEDTQSRIYHLVAEDVRQVPNFDFSQIVVKLPDSIDTEGDFRVRLVYRSNISNKATIRIFR